MNGKGVRQRSLIIALLNVMIIGFGIAHAAIFKISPNNILVGDEALRSDWVGVNQQSKEE